MNSGRRIRRRLNDSSHHSPSPPLNPPPTPTDSSSVHAFLAAPDAPDTPISPQPSKSMDVSSNVADDGHVPNLVTRPNTPHLPNPPLTRQIPADFTNFEEVRAWFDLREYERPRHIFIYSFQTYIANEPSIVESLRNPTTHNLYFVLVIQQCNCQNPLHRQTQVLDPFRVPIGRNTLHTMLAQIVEREEREPNYDIMVSTLWREWISNDEDEEPSILYIRDRLLPLDRQFLVNLDIPIDTEDTHFIFF